jgi:hypothetical protein
MAMFCEILMCRVLFTIYAYDSTEMEGAGESNEQTRDNGSNEEEKISVIRNLDRWPSRMSFREDLLTVYAQYHCIVAILSCLLIFT